MIFHVSDSGVFKSGLFVDLSSSPKPVANQPLISDNSEPAFSYQVPYLVEISSEGKAALNAMKSLTEGMNNFEQNADILVDSNLMNESDIDSNNNFANSISENHETEVVEEQSTKSYVNTNNLSRFTEYQLKQMVNDGSITRTDMNDELEKRNKSE